MEQPTDDQRILIVDDTPENLQALGVILRKEGYSVTAVDQGPAALDVAMAHAFDLILLDVRMPEMDGYEVCRQLQLHPETKDTPIIFITANNDRDSMLRGFQIGARDFVSKPFDSSELLARVHTHLELRESQKRLKVLNEHLEEEIEKRTRELSKALEERELLLKEVNHRVSNNLQFVSTLLNLEEFWSVPSDDIDDIISRFRNKIQTVALIHDDLYQSENMVDIDLEAFSGRLFVNYMDEFPELIPLINFEFQSELKWININLAIPCGLIINELITSIIDWMRKQSDTGVVFIMRIYFAKSADWYEFRTEMVEKSSQKNEFLNDITNSILIEELITGQLGGEILKTFGADKEFTFRFQDLTLKTNNPI